jgi:hypothetical protein
MSRNVVRFYENTASLEPEGVINLDSRGYEAMKGYGVGSGTSGGSYGGVGGGSDDSIPYGSLFSPKDLGSGGFISSTL